MRVKTLALLLQQRLLCRFVEIHLFSSGKGVGLQSENRRFCSCEMTHMLRVGQGLKGFEQLDLSSRYSAAQRRSGQGVAVKAFFGKGSEKPPQATGKTCSKCRGKGGVECQGCKGTGKNKKNGNMFERWKCYDCQGFGLVKCPSCGARGLTPEQRGER